jgi:hypothetical protein
VAPAVYPPRAIVPPTAVDAAKDVVVTALQQLPD